MTRGKSANEGGWNISGKRDVENGPRMFGYGLVQDILALIQNAEKFFGEGFAEGRLARRKAAQKTFQRACELRDKVEGGGGIDQGQYRSDVSARIQIHADPDVRIPSPFLAIVGRTRHHVMRSQPAVLRSHHPTSCTPQGHRGTA